MSFVNRFNNTPGMVFVQTTSGCCPNPERKLHGDGKTRGKKLLKTGKTRGKKLLNRVVVGNPRR